MKRHSMIIPAAAVTIAAFAQIASAHPGHGGATGFSAGVQHPFTGVDHILAMLAVGLCAAQMGGRARWMLPVTFLLCMIGGAALGIGHSSTPMVEQAIAASVLVLGLILVSGSKLAMPITLGLVGLFAGFHGFAHAAEMTTGLAPAAYGSGFLLATATLLATGLGAGIALKRNGWTLAPRLAGGAIAVCGVALFCM